jgi:hypothetical protein
MRRLGPAAAAALFGALAGVTWLAFFYVTSPGLQIDFAVDPPRLMTGVYPGERDQATGLTFAWTAGDVALRQPGLDRRVPWSVEIRVRGGRQAAAENPALTFFVDGARVLDTRSETEFTSVRFIIPQNAARPRGARITMQCSRTFVPGPQDPRPLGVMLDRVTLRPEGFALPPREALTAAALSAAALGFAIGLLGVTPGLAIGGAVLVAAGQGAVLARGFGPLTDLPEVAIRLALAIGIALVLIALLLERIQGVALRNTARFAIAFTAAAAFLKLLVLAHPGMPIGDALFHAHRFQEVLRGNYYFTSVAPGNYLFPYAPGLYVVARPFAGFVSRDVGDMFLLRSVVTVADAAVAASLYFVVVRAWGDRRAAAAATALHHLLPLDFAIISIGNLTNAFAQSLGVGALVVMSAGPLRLDRIATSLLLAVVLAAAFLSHTSTFAILGVSACAIALMFTLRGGPDLRRQAAAIVVATLVAAAVAVLLYYAHFMDTYRTELARIGAETATRAPDAGGRTITVRTLLLPYYLNTYLGAPALLLAAWGALSLWRRGARDRLALAVAGWAGTCIAFLLLGVLTPVDTRYYLASLPAVAIAAAVGASDGWERGGASRAGAAVLVSWVVYKGVANWIVNLG